MRSLCFTLKDLSSAKHLRTYTLFSLLLGLSLSGTVFAQQPLSDRVVAYKIDAHYDSKTHSLDATEKLTYENKTGQALDRFPFHLYLNAFQPKATWVREAHRDGSRDFGPDSGWEAKHTGSNVIKSLVIEGMGDLTKQIHFIAPDDGNPDDRTVAEVVLPRPLPPNQKITFQITFHAQFPEVVARTGYKRDFLLAGQWFPKVGVFWDGKWNCHQFHANTEFFADFGTFDVNVTVPSNFNFGSTGIVTATKQNPNGTTTYTAHAEDVHDFAWTADPTTKLVTDSVRLSTGNVAIRMLMQPGHMSSTDRYMKALKGTMQKFDQWYGPYPYPQITVVDPPHGGSAAGGMEYPMFITADTFWWVPKALLLPEIVVEHEYGHQYWYAMVASNEFEDAWLDEGINSYTEVKVMDALYGSDTSTLNSHVFTFGEGATQRFMYSGSPNYDPLTRNAWDYINGGSYADVTYGKTATMLLTLEELIGESKVREAVHTYFMRYRFKHPHEEDFLKTVNEVTGQNLDWYWNQAVKGTQELDYRIIDAGSDRDDWFEKERPKSDKNTVYTSHFTIHRKGDFILPLDVLVKFDDGSQVKEHWDGQDRWHRFEYQRKAKLLSAELYPGQRMPLDLHQFNNSYVVKGDRAAASKITMYWTWATQMLSHLLSWLA
jgi:Peptidase family M1 domain